MRIAQIVLGSILLVTTYYVQTGQSPQRQPTAIEIRKNESLRLVLGAITYMLQAIPEDQQAYWVKSVMEAVTDKGDSGAHDILAALSKNGKPISSRTSHYRSVIRSAYTPHRRYVSHS